MQDPILKLKNVSKFYYNKGMVASGFTKVNLELFLGEFVVITGESGSGKSTLLNVLSGLDSYEEGQMYINGEETSHYGENEFEEYRKTYIGNIFQSFNLVNSYSVYQNIELVLLLNGYKKNKIKDKIIDLIKKVDLYKYRNTKVSKLSGGQKQRVAIARALAKDTPIIIADEPTGNLDSKSSKSVLKLLSEIAKDKLVVCVTHNHEQVEEYATRKIEMSDGKIREDIVLRDHNVALDKAVKYDNLTMTSKIMLGIRNAFNIVSKCTLMCLVFAFLMCSFLGEYSSLKKTKHDEIGNGYNYYFNDLSLNRIVINKKDKGIITLDDINKIKNLDNVKYVETNDILLDRDINFTDNFFYFSNKIRPISDDLVLDEGRMPLNDKEIIIRTNKDNYYISDEKEKLLSSKLNAYTDNGKMIDKNIVVVGFIYDDEYSNNCIYVTKDFINKVDFMDDRRYTQTTFLIQSNELDNYNFKVLPSEKVEKGSVIISEDISYYCMEYFCTNEKLGINTANVYRKYNLDLKISKIINKNTLNNYVNDIEIEEWESPIIVNKEDYKELYANDVYQMSVFALHEKNVDKLLETLGNMDYNTLAMKDAIYNDFAEINAILNIAKVVVVVILFIVLFFISYFVIRLIQKSKNIYYSTVRILGGSQKDISSLIKVELYTIFNLIYFVTMIVVILNTLKVFNIEFISNLTEYLTIKDYIIIYLLMFIMSYLIASRYSRKLFKKSAMHTYRTEN